MFYSTKEFGKSCRGITSSESLGERSLMSKYLACSSMCEIYVIQASQTHLHNVRDVSRVLQQNHFRISNETRSGYERGYHLFNPLVVGANLKTNIYCNF